MVTATLTKVAIALFSGGIVVAGTMTDAQNRYQPLKPNLYETWPALLEPEPILPEVILSHLYEEARGISVRVMARSGWGTGVLLARNESTYIVITNRHVLNGEEHEHEIETSNGQIYRARELHEPALDAYDLALLEFNSSNDHSIAQLGESVNLPQGTVTFAAGFPLEQEDRVESLGTDVFNDGFKFTQGEISLQLERPLEEGYQLGYTNAIEKGMSGGPVLNRAGELIAINGIHADPLWGNPYVYQDGTETEAELQSLIEGSSWAIPIETVLQLLPTLASEHRVPNSQVEQDSSEPVSSESSSSLP
ncbi:serine protease [Phormidium yuhuli AB48]|uniref:Serine protease n=1 Tax=Phormidium yuhuli AB48 TaxID=2940671 RepID=A0ABY5ALL7_9CYAN|nr:serine protease [Phormidium yuhuli]USR90103.1 serine protease [Phormidium yuhuli AB48]